MQTPKYTLLLLADELSICKGVQCFAVLYSAYGIWLCNSCVYLCSCDSLHMLPSYRHAGAGNVGVHAYLSISMKHLSSQMDGFSQNFYILLFFF